MKSLVLISDEWFRMNLQSSTSSLLFGIFVIKKWAVFRLTSPGTLKYDWVIKQEKYFLSLTNNSVNIEFGYVINAINHISNQIIKND